MGSEVENWREKAERREAATVALEGAVEEADDGKWREDAKGAVNVKPGARPACSLQTNVLRMKATTPGAQRLLKLCMTWG
jgi:hypothetical protein